MAELWNLLLDAQKNEHGIPSIFVQDVKEQLKKRRVTSCTHTHTYTRDTYATTMSLFGFITLLVLILLFFIQEETTRIQKGIEISQQRSESLSLQVRSTTTFYLCVFLFSF
jgi:hypothetical protein